MASVLDTADCHLKSIVNVMSREIVVRGSRLHISSIKMRAEVNYIKDPSETSSLRVSHTSPSGYPP
jgi:hypothetical protein